MPSNSIDYKKFFGTEGLTVTGYVSGVLGNFKYKVDTREGELVCGSEKAISLGKGVVVVKTKSGNHIVSTMDSWRGSYVRFKVNG